MAGLNPDTGCAIQGRIPFFFDDATYPRDYKSLAKKGFHLHI